MIHELLTEDFIRTSTQALHVLPIELISISC